MGGNGIYLLSNSRVAATTYGYLSVSVLFLMYVTPYKQHHSASDARDVLLGKLAAGNAHWSCCVGISFLASGKVDARK